MNRIRRATSIMSALFLLMAATQTWAATPISACGTVINAPGSYVLTKNLAVKKGATAGCIVINRSYVSIDLGGFTIDCAQQSVPAITDGGGSLSGIIVRNGIITGFCFLDGLSLESSGGALIDRVTAIGNHGEGIFPGAGGTVLDSVINDNFIGAFLKCPSNAIDDIAFDAAGGISAIGSGCNQFNDLAAP
jgi:hypothetical protein